MIYGPRATEEAFRAGTGIHGTSGGRAVEAAGTFFLG
jgi:hypothetical protein